MCCLTCASQWAWGMAMGGWVLSGPLPTMVATLSFAHGHRLTVDEHVWFYGRLKSLSAAAVGPEQDRLMQDVGLVSKRHAQTCHLSGEEPLGLQR